MAILEAASCELRATSLKVEIFYIGFAIYSWIHDSGNVKSQRSKVEGFQRKTFYSAAHGVIFLLWVAESMSFQGIVLFLGGYGSKVSYILLKIPKIPRLISPFLKSPAGQALLFTSARDDGKKQLRATGCEFELGRNALFQEAVRRTSKIPPPFYRRTTSR